MSEQGSQELHLGGGGHLPFLPNIPPIAKSHPPHSKVSTPTTMLVCGVAIYFIRTARKKQSQMKNCVAKHFAFKVSSYTSVASFPGPLSLLFLRKSGSKVICKNCVQR